MSLNRPTPREVVDRLERRVAELEAEVHRLRDTEVPPILPEGDYFANITGMEIKHSRTGKRYVSIEATVDDDPYDRKVWINLVERGLISVRVKHSNYDGKRTFTHVSRISDI